MTPDPENRAVVIGGGPAGLMAAETGDMASIPGHIIPSLALGIPGSAPSAVLMAARSAVVMVSA